MTIFEKNIEALLRKNSLLASKLFAISENKRFEVFQGKDPVDINILDTQTGDFVYTKPVENTLEFIETHKDLERYPFRYFFGMGNGILIKMLLQSAYLKRIVVIEPDIEMLYVVLNILDFSDELFSEKLALDTVDEVDFVRALHYVGHNEAKIYLKIFTFEVPSAFYERNFHEDIVKVNGLFLKSIEHNITSHGNDIIDSLMGIEHHFKNLPLMIKNKKFKDLILKKNSKTAIIVSTGPSLSKQLPLLKKIAPYVTIISVDASFPILEKHGIKPDIVTVLERVPTTANFFKKNSQEFQKDVVFAVVSIAHEDVLNAIRDGQKVMLMRPHEYTQYFELDDFGYLGGGMSAANLAHEFAVVMKFERCIFIGQDLSFAKDGKSHATGHFFGENEEDHSNFNLYIEQYGGGGKVKTTMYWKLFKDYFEKLIISSSEIIDTINCTEGGARIEGAKELSFKEAIDKFVDFSKPKTPILLKNPTLKEQIKYKNQIIRKTKKILKKAREVQHKVENIFVEVQEASEELVRLNETNNLKKIKFTKLRSLVKKIDKVKTLIDDKVFIRMFYDVMRSSLIHQELDLAVLQVRPVRENIEKKAKVVEWVLAHRYWLFLFAGAINAQRIVMIRAIECWPEDFLEKINIAFEKDDLDRSSRDIPDDLKEDFKMKWLQEDGTYA